MAKGIIDKGDTILFEYCGVQHIGHVLLVSPDREKFFIKFEEQHPNTWVTRQHLYMAEVIEVEDGGEEVKPVKVNKDKKSGKEKRKRK